MRRQQVNICSAECKGEGGGTGGGTGGEMHAESQLSHDPVPGPALSWSGVRYQSITDCLLSSPQTISYLPNLDTAHSPIFPSEYEWHEQWYSVIFDIYKHSCSHSTEMPVCPPLTVCLHGRRLILCIPSIYKSIMFQDKVESNNNNHNSAQEKKAAVRSHLSCLVLASPGHHYNDLIIASGAPGQSQLQRPSGRRE